MNKKSVLPVLGGTLASLMAIPALGQQTEDESTQTVVVTGTRISRPSDFGNSSPVDIIDRSSIEKAGYANLQQLMEKMPSNGNGAFSTRGNNQDSTANGAASISLRGLGADATLVLVNGRRVAISPFAESITTNFVDINAIPVAAIERVEILKDGASALYGSDAIAGVINIILRKDYEGLELSGSYGSTTESGYDEQNYSAVWGFGGEGKNVTFILDYFKNSTLENAERGSLGSADQTAKGGEDFRSSRGYPGRFIVNGTTQIDPACPVARRAGQTCVYDFGSVEPADSGSRARWSARARAPGLRQRHAAVRRAGRAAQQLHGAGRAHAARRECGAHGSGHASQQPVRGRHVDQRRPLSHRRCGSSHLAHLHRQPACGGGPQGQVR